MPVDYEAEFKRIMLTIGTMALMERNNGREDVAESLVGLFQLMDLIDSGQKVQG